MFEISTTVQEINTAFYFIFAVSIFFLVGITLAMLWFVIRYNRKRHPEAEDISGNLPLEIAWTIIPTLLALGMFYFGWLGYDIVRSTPQGSLDVEVTGQMFFWTFKYPGGRQSRELNLPVGKPVRLSLESLDVNHSLYIPAYKIKEDVIPGRQNYLSFTPLREGVYDIFCAELCGTGHSTMITRLVAMPPKEYDLWLHRPVAQKPIPIADALAGNPAQIERGQAVFDLYCASCHGPKGQGNGVPNARNFNRLDGWKNGSKVNQMFRTLDKGLGKIMPAFPNLPYDDRFAVIHYVRRFASEHPADTPGEAKALDLEFNISKGNLPKPELTIAEAMRRRADEAAAEAPQTTRAAPLLSNDALRRAARKHPEGADLYVGNCARCHGDRGQGMRAVATLDEVHGARFGSLSLNLPERPWRSEDAESLRLRIEATSIATGGVKPAFSAFSRKQWQQLHAYLLELAPSPADPPRPWNPQPSVPPPPFHRQPPSNQARCPACSSSASP